MNMRRITLLAMLLVGILAGYAQSAIVGTYDGGVSLTHITGATAILEEQKLIISETEEGTIHVTFPSVAVLGQNETGEFTIEDVTATKNNDGTYTLQKDTFDLSFTTASGMSMSYGYSKLYGTVYAEGDAEVTVEIIQNPNLGALTTAVFTGLTPDIVSPIAQAYGGDLSLTHINGESGQESDKHLIIEKASGTTANVTFPSFSVLGMLETGDFTINNVAVTANEDGTYTLTNAQFELTVQSGSMTSSYPYSSFTATVSADGNIEATVKVAQNPSLPSPLTTATLSGKLLDASTFVWGKASWNIEDGTVFNDIDEFNGAQLTLAYPNPTGFNLTFLNIIAVEYDIYVDDSEEPISESSSAQAGTNVVIDYNFVEGHAYKIVTKQALLAQANLATYKTDTLSMNTDSYTISFVINGPELQKTIDVEAHMSLAITNQEYAKTVSKVNVTEITTALGIDDISEAVMHPLNVNGSYCDHMDVFDWWRDADGEFTTYYGGYNSIAGHNAYPAVYCIKVNEAADSVTYYFYDYWKEYVPDESETISGTGTMTRAPQTSYNSIIWDWENEDGTITQYKRSYRVNEGSDYVSNVIYIANGKSVILRATLHFVSQEEYKEITAIEAVKSDNVKTAKDAIEYYSITGARLLQPQKGLNIVRYTDGTTRKIYVK